MPRTGAKIQTVATKQQMNKTLLAICAAAALVYFSAQATELLIYDRDAIAQGQWWRLITGALTHFSMVHLASNLLTLLAIAWPANFLRPHEVLALSTLTSLAAGIYLYCAEPSIIYFAGLSGICSALYCYAVLRMEQAGRVSSMIGRTILAVLVVKTILEFYSGTSLVELSSAEPTFKSIPETHLIGILIALFAFFARTTFLQRSQPDNLTPSVATESGAIK